VAVAGTSEDVRARLQAFVDAGAGHLVIMPCETRDLTGAARRIVEEIIPELTGTPEGGLP
jgi:alkanesulfonate monooxygenase SsuD/methylene tetrahydromethanopterin reductase-like flavin-dependent oxidoreductase (luciferase family)